MLFDGMGFHLEQSLTGVNAHQHEEHAHNHDHYSLSLGLLLHRFPIGVLLYQKILHYKINTVKVYF